MVTIGSFSWSFYSYRTVPQRSAGHSLGTILRQSFDFRVSLIEVYRCYNLMVYYTINYSTQNVTQKQTNNQTQLNPR